MTMRAEIRTWQKSDAERLAVHANNRKIWLNLRDALPHPYTIENAREFIRSARAQEPETRLRRSAVKDGRGIDQMLYAYVVPEVRREHEHRK